jgi:hypothetical protein
MLLACGDKESVAGGEYDCFSIEVHLLAQISGESQARNFKMISL